VKVDEKMRDTGSAILVSSNEGKEVKLYSLEMLLNEFYIKEAVLKMDCEGCEYNILNEDDSVLKKNSKELWLSFTMDTKTLKVNLNMPVFQLRSLEYKNLVEKNRY